MSDFVTLWDEIVERSKAAAMPVVQERSELEYVFNLLRECDSYLEVGTAEGNSLYVLTQAMPKGSHATYIDWAEPHTKEKRQWVLDRLKDYQIKAVHGDSNDYTTLEALSVGGMTVRLPRKYDAVMIDAGHDDFNAAIDACFYGGLARKYIIFHDVQLPDVSRVFEWYRKQFPDYKSYRVVNSETYGYGIIEVK